MFSRDLVVRIFASEGGEATQTDVDSVTRWVADIIPERLCLRCYAITGDEWLPPLHGPCSAQLCQRPEDHHRPLSISIGVSDA
jgi:hypothetical protein